MDMLHIVFMPDIYEHVYKMTEKNEIAQNNSLNIRLLCQALLGLQPSKRHYGGQARARRPS